MQLSMTPASPAKNGRDEKVQPKPESGKLWVYECTGPGSPGGPPGGRSFLGMWPEPPYYYLFYAVSALEAVSGWIEQRRGWALTGSYELDYRQWQQALEGEQIVGPFAIRTDATISRQDSNGSAIPIVLDPGLVFGSGLHPTTRGCLLALAELFETEHIGTVLDFGTGTGILAVACALLGARAVVAADCNPLAVRVAAKNAKSNGVEGTVRCVFARELAAVQGRFDLLAVNIELPILRRVLSIPAWERFRRIVASGFLAGFAGEVESLAPAGFRPVRSLTIDGWGVLTFEG